MSSNPYDAPSAHVADAQDVILEGTFRHRFAARNFIDGLITAAIFPIQMAMLFGLPALIGFLTTRSLGASLACGGAVWCLFGLFVVRDISIDENGIRFRRFLGSPRFLSWARISSIHEVTREELIVHGWIWPILPAREMSNSLTSLGHFRIQFGRRWVYFPPEDRSRFSAAVQKYLPGQGPSA